MDVIRHAAPRRVTITTTHLMEEAEALHTRIGILVAGRLACLGSPEHLKAEYGHGYTIEVLLPQARVLPIAVDDADAITAVTALLHAGGAPSARLTESGAGRLRFEAAAVVLSTAFAALEDARGRGSIRDFSLARNSLESVFLRLSSSSGGGGSGGGGTASN